MQKHFHNLIIYNYKFQSIFGLYQSHHFVICYYECLIFFYYNLFLLFSMFETNMCSFGSILPNYFQRGISIFYKKNIYPWMNFNSPLKAINYETWIFFYLYNFTCETNS